MDPRPRQRRDLISFLVVFFILTLGVWVTPQQVHGVPLCLLQNLFHLDCPGCGLTRSFLSLARGNVVAAFAYNPAGPLIYLLFAAYGVDSFLRWKKGKVLFIPKKITTVYTFLVMAALMVNWIHRLTLPQNQEAVKRLFSLYLPSF